MNACDLLWQTGTGKLPVVWRRRTQVHFQQSIEAKDTELHFSTTKPRVWRAFQVCWRERKGKKKFYTATIMENSLLQYVSQLSLAQESHIPCKNCVSSYQLKRIWLPNSSYILAAFHSCARSSLWSKLFPGSPSLVKLDIWRQICPVNVLAHVRVSAFTPVIRSFCTPAFIPVIRCFRLV